MEDGWDLMVVVGIVRTEIGSQELLWAAQTRERGIGGCLEAVDGLRWSVRMTYVDGIKDACRGATHEVDKAPRSFQASWAFPKRLGGRICEG